ncbi:DUF2252 domain-containing protein [Aquibium carbonis]|uniref:DUF2252 domain-containing protein n=1 Tax=Aquibium carbonis TaxID=2495581 RepID=A0A3S0A2L1_9HYPH|nr:DUF2252 domain-containing protein [Aquibium carbonis]
MARERIDAPPRPSDPVLPAAELLAAGKALRDKVPRQAHADFKRRKAEVDPIAILLASDAGRLEHLVPIRYGRMLQSPFTFYRGSAAVMAADLAGTPATGLRFQTCGDCHLLNFGGFATPERNILFDINDFDETLPAPWEWDVKRLVASFVLAARSNGLKDSDGRAAAVTCARSYREHMRAYAEMSPLEVWYSRIGVAEVLDLAPRSERKRIEARILKASAGSSSEAVYPELAGLVGGKIRIHDAPPLIYHPSDVEPEVLLEMMTAGLNAYRATLADDRRALLDRYRLVDGAMKVVGIGSVGTFCYITLMMSANNDPLFLQWKEARRSVLEPYSGKSAYSHPGQRVVTGQRLMQPATDVFMGWTSGVKGRMGYVRQLRDAKIKPLVETLDAGLLTLYGQLCGWVLARAHAKAGNAQLMISGYLGTSDKFDEAMGGFAVAYADQTERDHAMLKAAVRAGTIAVELDY